MEPQMNLEDALQLFMKRIDIIVSMEMGGKLPTKEAYKEIKDEVRKLKKNKKQIHHEKVTAPPEPAYESAHRVLSKTDERL